MVLLSDYATGGAFAGCFRIDTSEHFHGGAGIACPNCRRIDMNATKRNEYGAIVLSSLSPTRLKQVHNLIALAARANKTDEHGGWQFGAEFDNKQRGWALNWDVYGIGVDTHTRRLLIVVQVRQYIKARKNGFADVRKSYFLVGRNEDQTVFAHPVESRVIHHAIRTDGNVIQAVQSWIFGVDYTRVLRQGDVALVPAKNPIGAESDTTEVTLQESHRITGTAIRENGSVYILNPVAVHLPGVHPIVEATGWYKVLVGRRADSYSFARPTID